MALRPWILAIDFGTSYTVAAAQLEGRSAEVIEIDGNRRVPSVVLSDDGRFVVGKLADELSAAYPGRTLRAPKRRIGDTAPVVLDGEPHQVVDLIAALLEHVYGEAVRQYGNPPAEVRLTHPAVWVRPQLNRLLEAATKAGIPHAVLVPEPVAAALAYATEVGVDRGAYVAVYDLGGGTFDTAVVTPANFGFQIVGRPGGDPNVGGELFDEILQDHIGGQLDPATWEAIQFSDDPTWRRVKANLLHEVRRAKEMLSGYPVAEVLVPVPGELVQRRVTREEFEALIEPHLEPTIDLLERCVIDAGVDPTRLAAVYLVGGASRTPLVTQLVQERFPGVAISRRGDPKTSTAIGAALAVRSGQSTPTPGLIGGAPTPTPTPLGVAPAAKPASLADAPTQASPLAHPAPMTPAPVGPPVITPAPSGLGAGAFGDAPTQQITPTPPPSGPRTTVQPVVPFETARPPKRRTGLWLLLGLLIVLIGAGVGAVVALSGDDSSSSSTSASAATTVPGTSTTAATGATRCVRQDIDFAAFRDGPDTGANLLDRIPAGSCYLAVTEKVTGPAGKSWLHLTWNGQLGYSAESNFLKADIDPTTVTTAPVTGETAPETTAGALTVPDTVPDTAPDGTPLVEAPGLRGLADKYFALVSSGDLSGAWDLLSANQQNGFGSFDAFTQVWTRTKAAEIVTFGGCTAADAPASCFFVADFTTNKGGVRRSRVRFDIVYVGPDLRIDSSAVDFVQCVTNNPGENDCSTS